MGAAKLVVLLTFTEGSTKCQGLCRALEQTNLTFLSLFDPVKSRTIRFIERQIGGLWSESSG